VVSEGTGKGKNEELKGNLDLVTGAKKL